MLNRGIIAIHYKTTIKTVEWNSYMMLHQIKILQPELFNAQPLKNITKFDVGVKVCIS